MLIITKSNMQIEAKLKTTHQNQFRLNPKLRAEKQITNKSASK